MRYFSPVFLQTVRKCNLQAWQSLNYTGLLQIYVLTVEDEEFMPTNSICICACRVMHLKVTTDSTNGQSTYGFINNKEFR